MFNLTAVLVRRLEEEQERQLLDVIATRQPVVLQDVVVVPELLNNLIGLIRREECSD